MYKVFIAIIQRAMFLRLILNEWEYSEGQMNRRKDL